MNYKQLSERLEAVANWSINAVGIRRIESRERRVTPDDLVALAVALGVSPVTLLMPESSTATDEVDVTGFDGVLPAEALWHWLRGGYPLPGDDRLSLVFQAAAWPAWRLKDQIESDKRAQGAWIQGRRAVKRLDELESGDGND